MLYHSQLRMVIIIKVGFIGPGKVGVNLARYFKEKGIIVTGFYGRNKSTAEDAANMTASKVFTNYDEVIKENDIIFITTPDDAVAAIDKELKNYNLSGKSVCHTSGSLESAILSNAKCAGALSYSIHPMFAFSHKNISNDVLENIYFSVEGDETSDENCSVIKLMKTLGNKFFIRNITDSKVYHLANSIVSNLVLSLLDTGTKYLMKLGLDEKDAFAALLPLIEGNIKNISEKGFKGALTGPVVRGDIGTVKKHLSVLNEEDTEMYKILSKHLLKLSEERNKNGENKPELNKLYEKLYEILGGYDEEHNINISESKK